MKPSDLATHEELLHERLDADPEYRREWERTTLARAVAVTVIRDRAEHRLSQAALATRLGTSRQTVARLESGEHNPTFPALLRVSAELGIELVVDITPSGQEPRLIGSGARRKAVASFQSDGCAVVVAASSVI